MLLGLSSPLKHSSASELAKRHKELGARAINFPVSSNEPHQKIMEYVEAAKENDLIIAEVGICEKVGITDPKYFAGCFKKVPGMSTKEYRNDNKLL